MRYSFLSIVLLTTGLTVPTFAAEKIIPENAQQSLNVTIYNADRALIKDTRTATLDTGLNQISFTGVSQQMIPQSALLQGKDIKTQEQNFNFDTIAYHSLMEKSVGTQVSIEYINPGTGEVASGTADLLAFNGSPVLKIGNKIETNYPGRVIFNKVPDNLRVKPTLTIDVLTTTPGAQPLDLTYLTTGLSWKADYVAEFNTKEDKLNLNGLVTLTNYSGVDYKNANLQLVAGDVNVVREFMAVPRMAKMNMMVADSMEAGGMVAQSLSDFYLYSLPRKTDILSNQTKQVALLSGQDVNVKKTYEFIDRFDMYSDEIKKTKPDIYATFDNKKDNNLGMALPKGTVRLYKADTKGNMLLVGEDSINHTANGEEVRLKMGQSFDLTADMKRTKFNKLPGNNSFEATYEIKFRNGGENAARVIISQNFFGQFRITGETTPSTKDTSNRVKWVVDVPANGASTLTYDLLVK